MTKSGEVEKQKQARIIGFYLPQYHPIPENDQWWGKGFTEWTNVAKAKPMFPGHYQPRIPADLGFYDLRVPETRSAQAELARDHGIEGFCYWHYWFAGERLLERPFNEVLKSGEPDYPFCLAWANESWTGVWHGVPDKILKRQTYLGLADYRAHFEAILDALGDDRYIKVNGKPLIVIYKPVDLPDPVQFTDCWRGMAAKSGLAGLYLVANVYSDTWNPELYGFDAITIPFLTKVTWMKHPNLAKRYYRNLLSRPTTRELYQKVRRRPVHVYPYEEAMKYFVVDHDLAFAYHPSVIPGWDNTPRSGVDGFVLHDSTPELFRLQMKTALHRMKDTAPQERIIFIKSWNEWAEGNYLEPDLRHGRAYLEVIRDEVYRSEGEDSGAWNAKR